MKRDKEMLQSKDKLYHLSFGGTIHHYSDMFFDCVDFEKSTVFKKICSVKQGKTIAQ